MKPATRNRMLAIAALVVAGTGLAYVALGNMGDNLVYYWSPKELIAQGDRGHKAVVRLGGLVAPGSIHWDQASSRLVFKVAESLEPGATLVDVVSTGAPPEMFREKIGVVVEGNYGTDNVFRSDRLMVKHSNEYRAPKAGDKPRLETLTDARLNVRAGGASTPLPGGASTPPPGGR